MKKINIVLVLMALLLTMFTAFFAIKKYEYKFDHIADIENINNMITPNSTNASSVVKSGAISTDAKRKIMQDINSRVSWIKKLIDNQWYYDHYYFDGVIYRYFCKGIEDNSLITYYFYYDEYEKLIYAEIAHYRTALYSISFHSNELFHVKVGPFDYSGGAFIDGNISDVQIVIAENPSYAFVLEDLAFCLSHAYQ